MTDFEYRKSIDDVIYLCSCAVNGTAPEKERIDALNLDILYEASQKHMLASMVGTVLKGAGVSSKVDLNEEGEKESHEKNSDEHESHSFSKSRLVYIVTNIFLDLVHFVLTQLCAAPNSYSYN